MSADSFDEIRVRDEQPAKRDCVCMTKIDCRGCGFRSVAAGRDDRPVEQVTEERGVVGPQRSRDHCANQAPSVRV